jgi:hypothetical protein
MGTGWGVEAIPKARDDGSAKTATAPVLLTPKPDGYPIVGWLVKAGAARPETSHGSQDGRLLPRLQGGILPGRARSQQKGA